MCLSRGFSCASSSLNEMMKKNCSIKKKKKEKEIGFKYLRSLIQTCIHNKVGFQSLYKELTNTITYFWVQEWKCVTNTLVPQPGAFSSTTSSDQNLPSLCLNFPICRMEVMAILMVSLTIIKVLPLECFPNKAFIRYLRNYRIWFQNNATIY